MSKFDLDDIKSQLKNRLGGGQRENGLKDMSVDDLMDAISHPKASDVVQELQAIEERTVERGDAAPDFTLPWLFGSGPDGGDSVTLSSHFAERPVALIFGSYT